MHTYMHAYVCVFCQADESQAMNVKRVLHQYELASGQAVNFDKNNVLFSKGVKVDKRARRSHSLDIREVLSHDK